MLYIGVDGDRNNGSSLNFGILLIHNDMSKKYNNQELPLNLDTKTCEAIKILKEDCFLEPLLVDLNNTLETEESQNSTK